MGDYARKHALELRPNDYPVATVYLFSTDLVPAISRQSTWEQTFLISCPEEVFLKWDRDTCLICPSSWDGRAYLFEEPVVSSSFTRARLVTFLPNGIARFIVVYHHHTPAESRSFFAMRFPGSNPLCRMPLYTDYGVPSKEQCIAYRKRHEPELGDAMDDNEGFSAPSQKQLPTSFYPRRTPPLSAVGFRTHDAPEKSPSRELKRTLRHPLPSRPPSFLVPSPTVRRFALASSEVKELRRRTETEFSTRPTGEVVTYVIRPVSS